jgi:hypothetical protein
VNAPLAAAWTATEALPDWAIKTKLLTEFVPTNTSDPAAAEEFFVRWRDGAAQVTTVHRDVVKHQIEMKFEKSPIGSPGECTIVMRPFFEDSTLVKAEIRLANDFAIRLAGLIVAPIGIYFSVDQDLTLSGFWRDLAKQHRNASEASHSQVRADSGRVHIIAVGVNKTIEGAPWKPLRFAEADAKAVFDETSRAFSGPENAGSIRVLLVGDKANVVELGKALRKMSPEREIVRAGDTILFFFAGHIDLEADNLMPQPPKHPYLVLASSLQDSLRESAYKRDDVIGLMSKSNAAMCMFVCDACYAGGFRAQSLADLDRLEVRGREDDPIEATSNEQLVILAGAGALKQAAESPKLEHGIFTYALLEGLRGRADEDVDHAVTLPELEKYLNNEVDLQSNGRQLPCIRYPSSARGALRWPVR